MLKTISRLIIPTIIKSTPYIARTSSSSVSSKLSHSNAKYRPFPGFYFYRDLHTTKMTGPLDQVSGVDIDAGTFKYVLIKVHHSPEGGPEVSKFIVRGYCSAAFHGDVYDQVTPAIEALGLDCECVGGGRIKHTPESKTIEVYGYSQGFGRADHSISVSVLKERYPDYDKITFSNDGY